MHLLPNLIGEQYRLWTRPSSKRLMAAGRPINALKGPESSIDPFGQGVRERFGR
jgi:hypothetical protein